MHNPERAEAMKVKAYRRKIESTYRLCAIRVCSAFRTISEDAAYVIAGLLPIDILAEESQKAYETRSHEPGSTYSEANPAERATSMAKWQQRWSASSKGRWTYRLIPLLETWTSRKHGEVDFYTAQLLSGHGCFRAYLYRFKHDSSPLCPYCAQIVEDAEHVFFHCPRFQTKRQTLRNKLGEIPTPENIVQHMIKSLEIWRAVSDFAKEITIQLRSIERERRQSEETL